MSFLTGIVGQWLLRRVMELGGLAAAALTAWNNLPPHVQEAIIGLLGAKWQDITLGTLVGLGVAAWGYIWSFVSTIKPHVTVDGVQTPVKALPADKQVVVEESARTAQAKRRTLMDLLTGR
jgi:hypothetical protein